MAGARRHRRRGRARRQVPLPGRGRRRVARHGLGAHRRAAGRAQPGHRRERGRTARRRRRGWAGRAGGEGAPAQDEGVRQGHRRQGRGVAVADIVVDGFTRVAYVPTISNINAPTTTELNAGILLQSVMTPDGLTGFEASTADVDNSALNSTFDTKTIGRDSFSGTKLIFKKQNTGDTAYTTLTRGTTGYIVVRRY